MHQGTIIFWNINLCTLREEFCGQLSLQTVELNRILVCRTFQMGCYANVLCNPGEVGILKLAHGRKCVLINTVWEVKL